jgi:hypothetical protein
LAAVAVLASTPGVALDQPNARHEPPLLAAAHAGVALTVKAAFPRAPEPPGPGDYPAVCQVHNTHTRTLQTHTFETHSAVKLLTSATRPTQK